jgi:VRR-NUC domain
MSKFQSKVIKEYESKGYIVWNVIKLSDSGYPDLALFKDGKTIFIECKEGNDTIKPMQKYRIDQLINEGFEAYCLHKEKGVIYGIKET